MDLSSKLYSHHKHLLRQKKKYQKSQKIDIETPPIKRSVTYNSDVDLLKKITDNDNLIELIEKIQKQKSPETSHHTETTERTILPPIKQNFNRQQYNSQRQKKYQIDQSYEPITQTINKRQINKSFDQYYNEKIAKINEIKKKDFDSIKTADTAVSSSQVNEIRLMRSMTDRPQNNIQNLEIQQKFKLLKNSTNEEIIDNKKYQIKLYSLSKQDYDNLDIIYSKQYEMNKIIKNALKMKSQKRDPANASKSVMSERILLQLELKRQYEESLDLAMQGYEIYKEVDNRKLKQFQLNSMLQRLSKQQKKLKQQKDDVIVTSQKKRLFVNKTIDIQGQCTDILEI